MKLLFSISIVLMLVGITNSFCQDIDSTITDEKSKLRKNEIGLNIAPVAVFLLGGESYMPRFSLTYKRLTKSGAFKIRANFFSEKSSTFGQTYQFTSLTLIETDSNVIKRQQYHYNANTWRFAFSYQWRSKRERKLNPYFGIGIIGGITTDGVYDEVGVINKDSLSNWESSLFFDERISNNSIKATSYSIGILPFAGLRVKITKHFFFSAEFEFGISYNSGIYLRKFQDNLEHEIKDKSFGVIANSLISDFSLYYRF